MSNFEDFEKIIKNKERGGRERELTISEAQYTLNDYKCECHTCIYAPNKECGWHAACNNCIDGSNYWRKDNGQH